ncbi:MAG: bifunctional riboflavin kinase/FAD synthetase [Planctomycetes bacterium]|nr:bifunctional riboflavin kinase/FAD synthetase [Planctomycetota bacterium]
MILTTDRTAPLPRAPNGSVVSIGVFDGVHLGHQEILARNCKRARALKARATVVTFQDHPKRLLLGRAPRTLTSLEHRLELFRRAGIEHTVALSFDEELRAIHAPRFVTDFLVENLDARAFVLGFDSKFGRDREGTPELLMQMGLDVEVVGQVQVGERAVSSTAIREAVELGDLAGAARMLGRPVAVYGEVVQGDHLGRELGFPTANLDLHHELRPPNGVWACRARRVRYTPEPVVERALDAVTNIGFRPTITGEKPVSPRVEVHLLDFEGDLYGQYIELEFVAFLREEQRFPSLEALKAQIARDVLRAREVLAQS